MRGGTMGVGAEEAEKVLVSLPSTGERKEEADSNEEVKEEVPVDPSLALSLLPLNPGSISNDSPSRCFISTKLFLNLSLSVMSVAVAAVGVELTRGGRGEAGEEREGGVIELPANKLSVRVGEV